MRVSDYHFDLPDELIAHYPMPERTASRLLRLQGENGELNHHHFKDLLSFVQPGDLMVFNNTRVIPARVYGEKDSGGKIEVLVERVLDTFEILAHVRASKSPKPGTMLYLGTDRGSRIEVAMVERVGSLFRLRFNEPVLEVLNLVGHIPLPPYIERADEQSDQERYQTVYNKTPGAVAAPTAGLHFDDQLLAALKEKGVDTAFVTLHVGAGTFQPVKVDKVEDHVMHSEYAEVSDEVVAKVRVTKAAGKRVIAVGTTSVRSLESASQTGELVPFASDTSIFIYPGYRFKTVDCLVTNFHLPESTLIMLISAFAGYGETMNAYRVAVAEGYRFFSYGDAMFISRNDHAAGPSSKEQNDDN